MNGAYRVYMQYRERRVTRESTRRSQRQHPRVSGELYSILVHPSSVAKNHCENIDNRKEQSYEKDFT